MDRSRFVPFSPPEKWECEDWVSYRNRYNAYVDAMNNNHNGIPYGHLVCIVPIIKTVAYYEQK